MSNKKEIARLSPDERREQILLVAANHFAREDQEAVSIQEIAADAGVTRALVYHYFPGKESLLEAVLQREAEKLLAATAPDARLSPRERLEQSLGAYLDHFSTSRGRLRDFYIPRSTTASLVSGLVERNHAIQVERILSHLGLDDTPAIRLAIGAWLGFVTEVARQATTHHSVPRADIIRLCLDALRAVTGAAIGAALQGPTVLRPEEKETSV